MIERANARDIRADIACAAEGFAWVEGVFELEPSAEGPATDDAYELAVVLFPFEQSCIVQTHYALLIATGNRAATGKVLYVSATHLPTVMRRANRIVVSPEERASARARITERKEAAAKREAEGAYVVRPSDVEMAFGRLDEMATAGSEVASPSGAASKPYRANIAIAAPLTSHGILEIVPDPFAPPRRGVLLVDDDPSSMNALGLLPNCDVIHVDDGWAAIDQIGARSFDLVLCSTKIGDFPGAKIFKVAVKERPELASRFMFLATASAVASAAPDSLRGRVLARPIDPATVKALLDKR